MIEGASGGTFRASRLLWPVVVLAVLIGALAFVLVSRGRVALEESEDALARGDVGLAIVFAKRAAQARLPGSPYPARASERLLEIGRAREAAGDIDSARSAYRAVVAAGRSTGEPHGPHAEAARQALAKLDGATTSPSDSSPVSGPPAWARFGLALGVLATVIGLGWLARGGRAGWAVLAVGLVAIATAALAQ